MTLEFEIIIDYVNDANEQYKRTINYCPGPNESEEQFHQNYARALHDFSTGKVNYFSWTESDCFKRTIRVSEQNVTSIMVVSRFLTGEGQ